MKIIVKDKLIETDFIYEVGRVVLYNRAYCFVIYFLNDKEITILSNAINVDNYNRIHKELEIRTKEDLRADALRIMPHYQKYSNASASEKMVLIEEEVDRNFDSIDRNNEMVKYNSIEKEKLESLRTRLIEKLAHKHISNIERLEL